jgi:hypothetical protein
MQKAKIHLLESETEDTESAGKEALMEFVDSIQFARPQPLELTED